MQVGVRFSLLSSDVFPFTVKLLVGCLNLLSEGEDRWPRRGLREDDKVYGDVPRQPAAAEINLWVCV